MNTENSKDNEAHIFKLHLEKINLKNPNKKIALVNLTINYKQKNNKNV